MDSKSKLTTAAGIPVGDNQNSLTAGPRGPLLVQDWQLFEKHAHFNRERIAERVVHAKGSRAYNTLTITQRHHPFQSLNGRGSLLSAFLAARWCRSSMKVRNRRTSGDRFRSWLGRSCPGADARIHLPDPYQCRRR